MNRIDDVINVAGHRLSTGRMEEVVSEHPSVAEVAVIGINDTLKGELPLGLVVRSRCCELEPAQLCTELVALVRQHIGTVAAFKQVVLVDKLPKTRSGKILRATMKKIANGEQYKMPATIEDPAVLGIIARQLG